MINDRKERAMRWSWFRREFDGYEALLASWTAFTVGQCGGSYAPNDLAVTDDGGVELIHVVADGGEAIHCPSGNIVRCLRLGIARIPGEKPH